MAFDTRLRMLQTQRMIMTPMLQQAIGLLQLSRLELVQELRQQIEQNPVLEEVLEEAEEPQLLQEQETPDEREAAVDEETHVTRSEEETFQLAAGLARTFRGSEVVLLTGALGAGKTVVAKGIAFGLGLEDPGRVCSPTFTLLNIYKAKFAIYHIDLYRLEKREDILDLGWEDWLGEGVVIVEWAEKVDFDPACPTIRISLEMGEGDERTIRIQR